MHKYRIENNGEKIIEIRDDGTEREVKADNVCYADFIASGKAPEIVND